LRETDRVMVLVRPEQVDLGVDESDGALAGRVTECHFFGHDMLVTVEMGPDGARSRVQARLAGRAPLPAGSRVSLSVAGAVKAWPVPAGPRPAAGS
jgi:TOBE domain